MANKTRGLDNLEDYSQLGKNHKKLDNVEQDGKEVYEIRLSYGKRVLYVLDDEGGKNVIGEFIKKNHKTTQQYLDDMLGR